MKRNKRHENRVRKMIVICCLSAIVLTASTYAWFIGMKTVNVAPFEVNIAAIDGLALSLDGATWSDTVSINADNYNKRATTGLEDGTSQNVWGKLIPMSSVGVINEEKSKLTLYEKGSLTASPGGYRLMASEVNNTVSNEAKGYVAFDLFVKNLSGNAYYPDVNELNEEAIYLTTESEVKVADAGAKADLTGIENSVRVAFAQIGRIEAETEAATAENIRGISCATTASICKRVAQIWEPNDTKHVANAISWYSKSCAKRNNDHTMFQEGAYDAYGSCTKLNDGEARKTYAIKQAIGFDEEVDVYDGADYNQYTQSSELMDFPYFTDTMKKLEGVKRPAFMTLAPKSITKIRVYVYLEGQDVDNYDFASLGKKISVGFGFSKERFTGEDIGYDGPELPSDVKKYEYIKLESPLTGDFVCANKSITYDSSKQEIKVPRGITEFTFNDNSATFNAKATVTNKGTLNPTYLSWEVTQQP